MKILISILAFVLTLTVFSQETIKTYETVTLVPETTKTLNSGGRSWIGGVSRVPIRVDLPENTVEWYYSFTTSAGASGTSLLNLAVQVGAYATNGPLGSAVAKQVKIPPGSATVDVWLIPLECKADFEAKNDDKVRWYPDQSEINTKQSVKPVSNLLTGSYYLGLRNPSGLDAVTITIEVVAIVEKVVFVEKSENQEKAELYGGLGWKQYENGEYQKCIDYCDKANEIYSLGWVYANKGLAQKR